MLAAMPLIIAALCRLPPIAAAAIDAYADMPRLCHAYFLRRRHDAFFTLRCLCQLQAYAIICASAALHCDSSDGAARYAAAAFERHAAATRL